MGADSTRAPDGATALTGSGELLNIENITSDVSVSIVFLGASNERALSAASTAMTWAGIAAAVATSWATVQIVGLAFQVLQ